jgi:hypothetical protein
VTPLGLRTKSVLAPLVYWLLLLGGLTAAHGALEHDKTSRGLALWVGAVVGTAMGQLLAWRRVRLWVLAILLPASLFVSLWFTVVVCWTDGLGFGVLEVGLMAWVPALLCGYGSLGERGALAAFWFPVAIWMLGILHGAEGATLSGAKSYLLLGALAVLFLSFVYAKELRRVAIWQTHGAVRLSARKPETILRHSPSRAVGQVAWVAAMGAASLALTAWVAPRLLQHDTVVGRAVAGGGATIAGSSPNCCPDPALTGEESQRTKEYLPFLDPYGSGQPASPPTGCVLCGNTSGNQQADVSGGGGTQPATVSPTAVGPTSAGSSSTTTTSPDGRPSSPISPSLQPSPVAAVVPTPTTDAPADPPRADVQRPRAVPPPRSPTQPVFELVGASDENVFRWLFVFAVCALAVQLALRPLRRLVTLRHLRVSLWPEPVDQQVSNRWQLALVGLRDAGWQTAPGEQPHELARRVALPELETCATVLERARHGVRVDAEDLDAMTRGARAVYRVARVRVGILSRALAWLRWPLV